MTKFQVLCVPVMNRVSWRPTGKTNFPGIKDDLLEFEGDFPVSRVEDLNLYNLFLSPLFWDQNML
jgi:hypothetical protein